MTERIEDSDGKDPQTIDAALAAGILRSSLDGVVIIDYQSRVLDWNPAAETLFGYTRGEAMGRSIADLIIPPPFRAAHYQGVGHFLATGDGPILNRRIEVAAINRSGVEFPVELVITPLDETPPRFAAALRDITERQAGETALRQSEARLRSRLRQQEAVAHIGVWALAGAELSELMVEATEATAEALEVELCKVLQFLPDEDKLLPLAGFGWEGLLGHDKIPTGRSSQAGYTLLANDCVIVDDLHTETRFSGLPLLHHHGVVSGISCLIPGAARQGPWGVLLAHTTRQRAFGHDDTHFLQSVANVLATAVERVAAEETLAESEARQMGILRDVLASVTDGRFHLCASESDLPTPFPALRDPLTLTEETLRSARRQATEGAAVVKLGQERVNDLLTSVGEATMNAVTHAGGGMASVCVDPLSRRVQVWVTDAGSGIEVSHLPQATLARGYTTTGTLGHGFKLMLQTSDHLWLLTGPTGTTVVLELGQTPPPLGWLAALL